MARSRSEPPSRKASADRPSRSQKPPAASRGQSVRPAKRYRSLAHQPTAFPLAQEALARRFHAVYQQEARRQAGQRADTVRHPDEYDELPEHTKDYDRALAAFVLHEVLPMHVSRDLEDALRLVAIAEPVARFVSRLK